MNRLWFGGEHVFLNRDQLDSDDFEPDPADLSKYTVECGYYCPDKPNAHNHRCSDDLVTVLNLRGALNQQDGEARRITDKTTSFIQKVSSLIIMFVGDRSKK